MKTRQIIQKLTVSALFVLGMKVVFASFSFSGIADEHNKNSKYSLKNLSNMSHRSLSYSSMKSNLQFKGTQLIGSSSDNQNPAELNFMMRFDNGNTTYVYPYKFKLKVPTKFKTPVAPHH